MSEIKYVTGDATQPIGDGCKAIVHICNDGGGWGKGFVLAISHRWKEPEAAYRKWHKGGGNVPFELGQIQSVKVDSDLWVLNLIGQHGTSHAGGKPPIRYEAVRQGLERVAAFATQNGASVHMPRIGCGLAGGKWEEVEPILEETLVAAKIRVTVYDYSAG